MIADGAFVDATPAIRMALAGAALALVPLAWTWWRRRRELRADRDESAPNLQTDESAPNAQTHESAPNAQTHESAPNADVHERTSWLRALTLTTLILTFDLVLFGSFTRLTDSGLGCPDWPGCYGQASPLGAKAAIDEAVARRPDGPVTHAKAWIEMIHRYFAMTVGALIVVVTAQAWRVQLRSSRASSRGSSNVRSSASSPWWPTATLAWVIVQGAFGALTVTMRLYPAIVTMHLLLGLGLLAMLAVQAERARGNALAVSARTRCAAWIFALLLVVQVALGGWVSTNYAVLACRDFPTCQGQWWPPMDFGEGFTLARELGRSGGGALRLGSGEGSFLPFAALTAIHVAHRIGALVLLLAIAVVSWLLWREALPGARRLAAWFAALGAWQLVTGLSNVVLGWPIVAALAHVAGAAGLTLVTATLLVRARAARASTRAAEGMPAALTRAS